MVMKKNHYEDESQIQKDAYNEKVANYVEDENEDEHGGDKPVLPQKKRGRPKKNATVEKAKVEVEEQQNDEAGPAEEAEDELEVEEYVHTNDDGEEKTYYMNPKNGDIYDPENEETVVVAKIIDGTFKFL